MTKIPAFSPGCFGSAIAFVEESAICSNCPFSVTCKPLHVENLARLRTEMGIPNVTGPKPRPASSDPAVDPATACLPRKVAELVKRLCGLETDIGEALRVGINPFVNQSGFLQITAHLLINMGQPVSRNVFSEAFQRKLNWSKGTADAHARMICQALTHIGAITEIAEGASIRRSA